MIYLDTHAVIFLYAGDLALFTNAGRRLIRSEQLIISPIVLLELEYLYEIKKLNALPSIIYQQLQKECHLKTCHAPFHEIIELAKTQCWTRDPFDRIIAAQSLWGNHPLLTKDKKIIEHCSLAKW